MKKYRHILIATDFSPTSLEAVDVGKNLAVELQAKLTIVHCIEPIPILIAEMQNPLLEKAETELAKLGNNIDIDDLHLKIAFGHIKKALIETIEEVQADLIIVGSHGHHGISRILGSTANAIINTAPCDVLVIRAKE